MITYLAILWISLALVTAWLPPVFPISERFPAARAAIAAGMDGKQFKGAFVRHLGYATTAGLANNDNDKLSIINAWLSRQVDSILTNNSAATASGLFL